MEHVFFFVFVLTTLGCAVFAVLILHYVRITIVCKLDTAIAILSATVLRLQALEVALGREEK
jgi:hypothetical protein